MRNIFDYLHKTPNLWKQAFVYEKAGDMLSLTFDDVQTLAFSVGDFLFGQGIYKQPVPVFMEKTPHMAAAFFGVVCAGNFYVPLDAEMPKARVCQILEAVNPPMIICDETTAGLVAQWGLAYPVCEYSEISATDTMDVRHDELANIRNRALDTDPVYVVFTSGSTGVPKGVVACHRGVIDYVDSLSAVLGVNEDTVFGLQSPLYLDACLKEIFSTLKCGATTYFIPNSLFMFPVKLLAFIKDNGINTICWVASALSLVAGLGALDVLEKDFLANLRTVAFGSEVFPMKHLEKWREALPPDAKMVHLYGPTEATGMSAYYVLPKKSLLAKTTFPVPIGKPFLNREIILLDDSGKAPPAGEPGEIHIRGSQLSLGYFNDPERTKAAFIQNPASPYTDIMYKTGDLGYVNADGNLVFTARRDHQIKHMGYRIELTEIEIAAQALDGIEMTCAVFDEEKSRIILHYTTAGEGGIPASALKNHLKSALPRYMVPHSLKHMEALPLTPGGKIDRAKLRSS